MAYAPRGRLRVLLDAMHGDPDHVVWTAPEAARVLLVGSRELGAYTQYAVRAGVLFRTKRDGLILFSLRPFPDQEKGEEKRKARKQAKPVPVWNPGDDPRVPRVDPNWRPPVMVAPRGGTPC